MKKIILSALFLLFTLSAAGFCYAETVDIEGIADSFQNATDLKKSQILADNLGKEISSGGMASNVDEYDFFDTANNIKGSYYRLTTEQQKTKNNLRRLQVRQNAFIRNKADCH